MIFRTVIAILEASIAKLAQKVTMVILTTLAHHARVLKLTRTSHAAAMFRKRVSRATARRVTLVIFVIAVPRDSLAILIMPKDLAKAATATPRVLFPMSATS